VRPVLEYFPVTPEQSFEMGLVEVSESAPQNNEMAGRDGADRVQLNTS
jgi:hypothetical protein